MGPLTLGHKQDSPFLGRDIGRDKNYSEEVAYAIDQEVRKTIDRAYENARELLTKHRETLDLIAQTLMEKETIEAEAFAELMKDAGLEKPNS
ncbi:hypothetical protein N752_16475 [Desulforamulus aquiferis]|nr:hypothetical protein N752_16475 [Desulforamulus aquiferis]